MILTGVRTGDVLGATWDEIDLTKAVWVVPAGRIKARKEHHIPLSPATVNLLKDLPKLPEEPWIFQGAKGRLSNMAMSSVLKRMGRADITVHGFRSTFRDWAAERTNYAREVCEHALAHQLKDKSEAAYQRGSLFDKRRMLMNDWEKYCGKPSVAAAAVVPINRSN